MFTGLHNYIQNYSESDKFEKEAVKALFFKSYLKEILILVPMSLGFLFFLFTSSDTYTSGTSIVTQFELMRSRLIFSFLEGVFVGITVIIAMVQLIRWISSQSDGSFGYWVGIGAKREKILRHTLISTIYFSTLGVIIGFILVFSIGGISFGSIEILALLIATVSNIITWLLIGLILSQFIQNQVLTPILFLFLAATNLYALRPLSEVYRYFLAPQFNTTINSLMVGILLSLLLNILLFMSTLWVHKRSELVL